MRKFGLIGKNISYSFSRQYFEDKFQNESITDASYENFDIPDIQLIEAIFKHPEMTGLNVTIPYKETVIPYLDKLQKKAKKIGAVNTIKITKSGEFIGFNTDCYGFKKSLKPLLKPHHKRALILGTGGASKAVAFALKELGIAYQFVSRKASDNGEITYKGLTDNLISTHLIIINCTPLGIFPDIENYPNIPYQALTSKHILYDLIYNPQQTKFLIKGEMQGATTINGQQMLRYQAEKAWRIWNKH